MMILTSLSIRAIRGPLLVKILWKLRWPPVKKTAVDGKHLDGKNNQIYVQMTSRSYFIDETINLKKFCSNKLVDRFFNSRRFRWPTNKIINNTLGIFSSRNLGSINNLLLN